MLYDTAMLRICQLSIDYVHDIVSALQNLQLLHFYLKPGIVFHI